jgi:hypothetical protein
VEFVQTTRYELAVGTGRAHICNIEEWVLHHKGTSVNERPRVSQKCEDHTNVKTAAK